MSHHIYQTDGFILGSVNRGEANRYLAIFTRDLGMIQASAQGIRLITSKLRYSLQDYTLCHLSLVRGKDTWRITSASKILNLHEELQAERKGFKVFLKVFSLLRRLLAGEEKNEDLFYILHRAFYFLKEHSLTEIQLSNFEYVLVLRILNSLGYLGDNSSFKQFLNDEVWTIPLLQNMGIISREVVSAINSSLKESQL